jgi:hypothetical protein
MHPFNEMRGGVSDLSGHACGSCDIFRRRISASERERIYWRIGA